MGLAHVEEVGSDQVHCGVHLGIGIDEVVRIVGVSHCRDLVLGVSEDEAVLESCFLCNLHVGAVQGSDGQSSVEHELHVARARGLESCS